jgi:hypothetical protein
LAPQFPTSRSFRPETEETVCRPNSSKLQPPSEGPTEPVTDAEEFCQWRIADYALVVARNPSLLGGVIVPVIIKVKAPKSNQLSDVYRALGEAIDQLSAQAGFLFSDFEPQ